MTMRHRIMSAALATALTVLSATPAHAAERQYVKTDLGTLDGGSTWAVALNEAGVVVGLSGEHAFRWQNGRLTDLGTLPGGGFSIARDINESGVVAGISIDAAGNGHAVIWRGTRIIDLGLGSAVGINDRGQVIGDRTLATGTHRMLYQNGRTIDLGPIQANTYSNGINNRGDIIATFPEPPGRPCGCTASAGIMHNGRVTTFGSFGPTTADPASFPLGSNDRGDVVGISVGSDSSVLPFRWHHGTLTQLPLLGGYQGAASDINDHGLAVGTADGTGARVGVPVTWAGSVVNDLTDQGFDVSDSPGGVNNRGWIITTDSRNGRAALFR